MRCGCRSDGLVALYRFRVTAGGIIADESGRPLSTLLFRRCGGASRPIPCWRLQRLLADRRHRNVVISFGWLLACVVSGARFSVAHSPVAGSCRSRSRSRSNQSSTFSCPFIRAQDVVSTWGWALGAALGGYASVELMGNAYWTPGDAVLVDITISVAAEVAGRTCRRR